MAVRLRPRWGSFSLRSLFLVVTAFAILWWPLSWIWQRHNALADRETSLFIPELEASSGSLAASAPWPLRMFGEKGIAEITLFTPPTQTISEGRRIRGLFPEAKIMVRENCFNVVTAPSITTPGEFEAALGSDLLVIHFDVDWSIHAQLSRPVVAEFRKHVENDPQFRTVQFRRIDCSDQDGEFWSYLYDWFVRQKAEHTVITSGYGAIVWVKARKVYGLVQDANRFEVAELMAKTTEALADGPTRTGPGASGRAALRNAGQNGFARIRVDGNCFSDRCR